MTIVRFRRLLISLSRSRIDFVVCGSNAKDFVKSNNNVELPALLQSSSISAVYTEGSKLIVRLSFIGNSAGDPIVSGMVKKFDVDINIIYGNIDSLKDIPFGTLVIRFQEAPQVSKMLCNICMNSS